MVVDGGKVGCWYFLSDLTAELLTRLRDQVLTPQGKRESSPAIMWVFSCFMLLAWSRGHVQALRGPWCTTDEH